MSNTPYTPKDYGNEARAKDVLSRINKPKATPDTPTYCCTNHCTAKGKVCPCEAAPDQVDALDALLDDWEHEVTGTPKHWKKTPEREAIDKKYKAKLSALLVGARIDELRYVRDKLTADTPTFINIQDRIKELEKQREADNG